MNALQGRLSAEALLRVLGTLYGDRHTGVLHLGQVAEPLSLRFVGGHVVSGASGPSGRLGDILVRHGHVDREDLEMALEKAAIEDRRLGPVLVETGMATREEVQEALRLQVRDVLLTALSWGSGAYRFEPDAGPAPYDEVSLEISTPALIFELVGALEDPSSVLHAFVDPRMPLEAVRGADTTLRRERAPLAPTDAFVLSRADGGTTLEQIVACSGAGQGSAVERSLLALLACRALLPRPERRRVDAQTPAFAPEPDCAERQWALRRRELQGTLERLESCSHHEVLGVGSDASLAEVKRAFGRLARRYHPDTAGHPSLAEATKAIFLRASEAHAALSAALSRQAPSDRASRASQEPEPTAVADERSPLPGAAEAIAQARGLLAESKAFEAVALLEDVLPHLHGPSRAAARLLRARAYLKTPSGRHPAESELRDLLAEDPSCTEAVLMLARLYRDHGMTRRAAGEYARVLALAPGHPEAAREARSLEAAAEPAPVRLKLAFGFR